MDTPSHTPTRTEENLATRPLLPTPTRAEEHLAVTPGCKPRAPDAKERGRCLENRPWANNGLRTFKELVKKPLAWVSKGALETKIAPKKKARPGAQDCLP